MQAIKYQLYNEIKKNELDSNNHLEIIAKIIEIIETTLQNDDQKLKHNYLLSTLDNLTKINEPDEEKSLLYEEKELIPQSTIEKIRLLIKENMLEPTIKTLLNASRGKYLLQKSEGVFYSSIKYIGNTFNYYVPISNYLPTSYFSSYFSQPSKSNEKVIQSQEDFVIVQAPIVKKKTLEPIIETEEKELNEVVNKNENVVIDEKTLIKEEENTNTIKTNIEVKQNTIPFENIVTPTIQTVNEILNNEKDRVTILEKIEQSLKTILDIEDSLKNISENITEEVTEKVSDIISEQLKSDEETNKEENII
jgi:hypothetical protein